MAWITGVVAGIAAALLTASAGAAIADSGAAATHPSAAFDGQMAKEGWAYGWTNGMDKVLREGRPFDGNLGGAMKVELAANEYEGVQLVLRSETGRKHVRVSVSDLVAEGGGRIAAKQVKVLLVGYVDTKKPPYAVDHVGWWPDPLLDFLPTFDLDAGVWQPVWLDVHTAARQAAGVYRGEVTVAADGVEPMKAPLEVTVWNFAVPETYHFPLAVSNSDDFLQPLYSKDKKQWALFEAYLHDNATLASLGTGEARHLADIWRKCQDMILDHHLIPDNIYRDFPPRIDEVMRWKEHGARWFNIMHVSRVPTGIKAGDPYPAAEKKRILDTLADYVPKLKKAGLLDMAYIYGFDEIESNQFAAMKDIFGAIKKRYPTIPLMTTARDKSYGLDTGLDSCVNIWVPQTDAYGHTLAAIDAARKRGRKVWWYICCVPHHPYANWFIEYTGTEQRLIMGFMPWKLGAQGFLYYSMNLWATNQEVKGADGKMKEEENVSYKEVLSRGPLTNYDGKSWTNYNGDGLIYYPGPDGPVATIRMKCIRDGLEDYEYLWLLRERVEEALAGKATMSGDWMKRAQAALAVDPALVSSVTKYTTNGSDVLAARRVVAELLTEGR